VGMNPVLLERIRVIGISLCSLCKQFQWNQHSTCGSDKRTGSPVQSWSNLMIDVWFFPCAHPVSGLPSARVHAHAMYSRRSRV
jgi:hypothetical protein